MLPPISLSPIPTVSRVVYDDALMMRRCYQASIARRSRALWVRISYVITTSPVPAGAAPIDEVVVAAAAAAAAYDYKRETGVCNESRRVYRARQTGS